MKKYLLLLTNLLLLISVSALELPIGVQKIIEYQQQLAISITLLIAFIGGIISFTSPCGFVILPAFFSYVFKERKKALCMTGVFSLGMTLAFVLFGLIAGAVGNFFNVYKETFAMISGLILIIFGVMLALNKGFSIFDFKIKHQPNHTWSIFWLGFFFAVGWTPCVGPILGGIIILSANTASMLKGAMLFGAYALGVSLPLLILSYFSDKFDLSKFFTSKHIEISILDKKLRTHLYGIIGGLILVIIGLIMLFGKGTSLFMEEIPKIIPWTMDLFSLVNERITESEFFTGNIANIAGLVIILIMLYIIYKSIHHRRNEEFK